MNESVSSFQNHIMSKILANDNIVKALADPLPDFLGDRYGISNDNLPEFNSPAEGTRKVIRDGRIYRYALKYDRVLPYLYDSTTETEKAAFIFFDVSYEKESGYGRRFTGQNNIMMPYEIHVNISVHNSLVVTDYSKSRSTYIAEEIESELCGDKLGRGKDKSVKDTVLIYNRPNTLSKGRAHGRSMLFIAVSTEGC